eukprot:scaffold1.g5441.t1
MGPESPAGACAAGAPAAGASASPHLGLLQLRHLVKLGLQESAELLGNFLLSEAPGPSLGLPHSIEPHQHLLQQAEVLSLLAEALVAGGEQRRAHAHLRRAVQCLTLAAQSPGLAGGLPTVAAMAQRQLPALLRRSAACLLALGEEAEAAAELERVAPPDRTAGDQCALGRCYRRRGMRGIAAEHYRAALALCPFALEAAVGLAELREPAAAVEAQLRQQADISRLRELLHAEWQQPQAEQQRGPPQQAAAADGQSGQGGQGEQDGPGAMSVDGSTPVGTPMASRSPTPDGCRRGDEGAEAASGFATPPRAAKPQQDPLLWGTAGSPVATLDYQSTSGAQTPVIPPRQRETHAGRELLDQPDPQGQRSPEQGQPRQGGGGHAQQRRQLATPPRALRESADDLVALIDLQRQAMEQVHVASALVQAAAATADHDFAAAVAACQQLLAQRPTHPHVLAMAAAAQADLGNAAVAVDLFARAHAADPHCLSFLPRHADLLRAQGDALGMAQLAAAATTAGQLDRRPEPWLVSAAAVEAAGDLVEAVSLIKQALARDARSAEAWLATAGLLQRLEAAMGAAAAAVASSQSCAADFQRALALQPSLRAYRGAVRAHLDAAAAGQPHELACALALAAQAEAAFPSCPAAQALHAEALAAAPGRRAAAVALFERALARGCAEAALGLASLHCRLGQRRLAMRVLESELGRPGGAPCDELHVRLGLLAVEGGAHALALTHFSAAMAVNPHNELAAEASHLHAAYRHGASRGWELAALERRLQAAQPRARRTGLHMQWDGPSDSESEGEPLPRLAVASAPRYMPLPEIPPPRVDLSSVDPESGELQRALGRDPQALRSLSARLGEAEARLAALQEQAEAAIGTSDEVGAQIALVDQGERVAALEAEVEAEERATAVAAELEAAEAEARAAAAARGAAHAAAQARWLADAAYGSGPGAAPRGWAQGGAPAPPAQQPSSGPQYFSDGTPHPHQDQAGADSYMVQFSSLLP